jgi:hypothetical protein
MHLTMENTKDTFQPGFYSALMGGSLNKDNIQPLMKQLKHELVCSKCQTLDLNQQIRQCTSCFKVYC